MNYIDEQLLILSIKKLACCLRVRIYSFFLKYFAENINIYFIEIFKYFSKNFLKKMTEDEIYEINDIISYLYFKKVVDVDDEKIYKRKKNADLEILYFFKLTIANYTKEIKTIVNSIKIYKKLKSFSENNKKFSKKNIIDGLSNSNFEIISLLEDTIKILLERKQLEFIKNDGGEIYKFF